MSPGTEPIIQLVRIQSSSVHLLEDLDNLYRGFAHEEGHTARPEHFIDFIAPRLSDDSMLVILAMVNNSAVGYALVFDVMAHPFIPNWERSGYITQMFVDGAHRQMGIGQKMADYSFAWLTERGVSQVMLNVDVENDGGERFWEKAGFTPYLIRMKHSLS